MEKKVKPDNPDAFLWLKDAPTQPHAPGRFAPEQMTECEKCGRKNAPTRHACLYCGATLLIAENDAGVVRPTLRRLENWEKGWNVIYLPHPADNFLTEAMSKAADFVRLEHAEWEKILEAKRPLPVARAESETEAGVVNKFLRQNGFHIVVLADADLHTETLPKRVRGLEFGGSYVNLHLFGAAADEPVCLFYAEIEMFVAGAIYEKQIENRERRKGEDRFEIKDSREIASDETVLDFYAKNDSTGYRISARNFDFSCLGTDKKLLASENFGFLLNRLRERAAEAAFDDSYKKMRTLLNLVWQPDERSESLGWQREGLGKFSVENRLTVSNAAQFLRYSRMLRELKKS